MTVNVYMAAHNKQTNSPYDYIIPIQAGAKLSNQKLYKLTDDTGDNISEKNNTFCELTALYWVWKNDYSDFAGLCHYRRFFDIEEKELEEVFNEDRVVVPVVAYLGRSLKRQYLHNHKSETWRLMTKILAENHPEYIDTAQKVFNCNKLFPFNMFIGSRKFIEDYCEWLFGILFEVEQMIEGFDWNRYQKRYAGFLAERLFTLYVIHNNIDIENKRVINENKHVISQSRFRILRNKLFFRLFGGTR